MLTKKCPQCSNEVEVTAVSCPQCGLSFFGVRYQARTEDMRTAIDPAGSSSNQTVIIGAAAAVVLVVLIGGYFLYPVVFAVQREAQVETAVAKGDATKAGISDKNREASRAALNAIGELESVTSVGTNYQQYTATLQSAKIKFDAAIRDLKPLDDAEYAILSQLEEAMLCHVDAKDAWSEFIQSGDEFNFLTPGKARTVASLSSKYGFSPTPQNGEYHRSTVLQTIWSQASEKFKAAESKLR